ncbi:MAG: hypothetical protein JSV44_03805, partial [Candidatus Zixiibacteriota bacterium]
AANLQSDWSGSNAERSAVEIVFFLSFFFFILRPTARRCRDCSYYKGNISDRHGTFRLPQYS